MRKELRTDRMVTELLRRKRGTKRIARGSLAERLVSAFENAPDPNPLVNVASFFLIMGGILLLLVFSLISEGISFVKKLVTAPFHRGNKPPTDGTSAS